MKTMREISEINNMQKQEDKYNATGQLLDFIPKFYFWMLILIVVFAICCGLIIWH
jgi:cytochrome b subunit of formate dehydrogenase